MAERSGREQYSILDEAAQVVEQAEEKYKTLPPTSRRLVRIPTMKELEQSDFAPFAIGGSVGGITFTMIISFAVFPHALLFSLAAGTLFGGMAHKLLHGEPPQD